MLASRGRTRIVRHRLGLVLAAAGIDRSNVEPGRIVLLPRDPDGSAARLRAGLRERLGRQRGGGGDRHLRPGLARGPDRRGDRRRRPAAAGEPPRNAGRARARAGGDRPRGGRRDRRCRRARPGQARRTARSRWSVGAPTWCSPVGEDGPGAGPLQRVAELDMFSLGVREAVVTALAQDGADQSLFGPPATPEELGVGPDPGARCPGPARGRDRGRDGPGTRSPCPRTPRARWSPPSASATGGGWRDSRLPESRSGAGAVVRLLPVIP